MSSKLNGLIRQLKWADFGSPRSKPAPKPGDLPEMRIELDTMKPHVELFIKPGSDPLHRDRLILTWIAKDKNLAPNSVNLDWAERLDGPWQPIAVDLPNTQQYAWQVPASIPVQVYLRLRVRERLRSELIYLHPPDPPTPSPLPRQQRRQAFGSSTTMERRERRICPKR